MAIRLAGQVEPLPGYRLIERLGTGGFGEVWKVEAPGGIPKAIKLIHGSLNDERSYKQATQELKSLNRVKDIHHPFLLQLERVDIVDGQLIIVMELADRDLMMRFKECQRLGLQGVPRSEMLRYMEETAEVLDLMNLEHGLQHLDIKPQNLFLIRNHIKVADFGMVKDLQGITATVTGGITPLYAAPETFDNRVSRTSDQYSLAIVYQELLTGVRPFSGANAMQLLMQHCSQAPDLTPLPAGDREVIGRALSKKHGERFPSCTELVKALRKAPADALPGPAGASGRPGRTAPADSPTPASLPQMHKDTKPAPAKSPQPPAPVPEVKPDSPTVSYAAKSRPVTAKTPAKETAVNPQVPLPPPGDLDPQLGKALRKKKAKPPQSTQDTVKDSSPTERLKRFVKTQETIKAQPSSPSASPCPRCGHGLMDPGNLAWCAKCGYCGAIETTQVPGPETDNDMTFSDVYEVVRTLPAWVWVLVAGVFTVCLATLVAELALPTVARGLWATGQFSVGLIGLLAAHVWAFLTLARLDLLKDDKLRLYSLTFRFLPETRGPVWVGAWCLTLLLGSLVLGVFSYWFNRI